MRSHNPHALFARSLNRDTTMSRMHRWALPTCTMLVMLTPIPGFVSAAERPARLAQAPVNPFPQPPVQIPLPPEPGIGPAIAPELPPGTLLPPPPSLRDYSFIFIDAPPPPELIKVHDIITIEVDEKAEVIVNSRFNRQRNGSFTAQLKEFVRIRSDGPTLEPTAFSQPSIEGNLQNRLQTIGQLTDLEGITYKIAATVVEVLPNGTIVLEARKSIRTNQDMFEYRLTGRIDKAKIKPDRTARTEDIAELKIDRLQRGKVFDSTKTNWGTRVLDIIFPF